MVASGTPYGGILLGVDGITLGNIDGVPQIAVYWIARVIIISGGFPKLPTLGGV